MRWPRRHFNESASTLCCRGRSTYRSTSFLQFFILYSRNLAVNLSFLHVVEPVVSGSIAANLFYGLLYEYYFAGKT